MRRVAREPDLELDRDGAERRECEIGVIPEETERAHASNRTPVGAARHRSQEPPEDRLRG